MQHSALVPPPICLSITMYGQNINLPVCVSVCLSVCVSVTLSVNSPTGQTPQRICTVDSLKERIYARMCLLAVSVMNYHI